tara:strand:+ start:282 stop:620 length:339 start_codon:yes stop_codon:yes gene_type:complete
MKNLTKQSQKTYYRIQLKSRQSGSRFPSLKSISKLLDELNIENQLDEWSETKWRENGLCYHTSGGGTYYGWRLRIPKNRMEMISTDSYYSWNTYHYAMELERLIKESTKIKC